MVVLTITRCGHNEALTAPHKEAGRHAESCRGDLTAPAPGWRVNTVHPLEDKMDKRLNRRAVTRGAGVLTGFAAAHHLLQQTALADDPASPEGVSEQSLYDRVGGIFAISAVVDRFSDAIITNPKLNVNPALKAWNENEAAVRLPGLKVMRTIWIAALTGGPFVYTGLPLHEAHTRFHLTSEEFDEVGAEIVRALDFYGVQEREKKQLVDAYMLSKPEVVASPE
jgi:hemoglobin